MIISFAKETGMKPKEVLYDISYQNVNLYGASIPHYDDVKDITEEFDDEVDACNPKNMVPIDTEDEYFY